MKRRDLLLFVCLGASLVGVAGQFGPWWALIIGGLAGALLLVGLTFAELSRPRRRRKC